VSYGWPQAGFAADESAPLIALVHTQAAGDEGITDDMIAAFRRVVGDRGMRARVIYASDPMNYEPILELLGEYGALIVLGTFEEMGQPLSAAAREFPKTRFVEYQTYMGAYLTGVCAARISRTGKIGYIGGTSIPTLNADVNAMIAGARSVVPALPFTTAFVGSFQDPIKGSQIAEQMYRSGIDFIQVEGAASDIGVIKAASAHPGRIVSGAAAPEITMAPSALATILLCDFATSIRQQVIDALDPRWHGGHYKSGLVDNIIRYYVAPAYFTNAPAADAAALRAAWPHVERARTQIVTGALTVPLKTNL